MKNVVSALALLAGISTAGWTQASPPVENGSTASRWGFATYVGTFAPILSLVAIQNGKDADVRLQSAPSIGAELTFAFNQIMSIYGGATHVRSRVNHSTGMTLIGADERSQADSPVGITSPSMGFLFSPQLGSLAFRPTIRIGGGVKFYDFALREVKNGVQDPMADLGLGIVADGSGSVSFTAEARWTPSSFDPKFLPVPLIAGKQQLQNDWVFHLGLKFGL